MPSELGTKDLHSRMLILLEKFHEICIKNGIKYSLHGGTLLGAIREKGFIPWDDDADVTMMRIEYEKLCKVMKSQDPDGSFLFFDHLDLLLPRLCLVEKEQPIIWIDIFVYDYISQYKLGQKFKNFIILWLKGCSKTSGEWEITKVNYSEREYRLYYIACLPSHIFPVRYMRHLHNFCCQHLFCGNKKMIHRSNDKYIGMVKVLPTHVMKQYMLVPFENIKLMISRGYKDMLVSMYGEDYLIPKKYAEDEFAAHDIFRRILEEKIAGN